MRKAFVVPAILFCVALAIPAQAQWAKAYGSGPAEEPIAVLIDGEGDLFLSGLSKIIRTLPSFYPRNLEHRSWFMKISGDGNDTEKYAFSSQKTDLDPDAEAHEQARSLRPTEDGGYILVGHLEAGWTEGYANLDYNCAFILKLSSDYQIEWQRFFGNDDRDTAERALAVEPTDDGGYIAVGSTSSFGIGDRDVWVMKLDSAGQVVWQKAYGGEGREEAHLVRQTPDGGFMVVGYATSFQPETNPQGAEKAGEPGLPEVSRIWVLRLNPEGALIWQQVCGRDHDLASSMVLTPEGAVLIGGSTEDEPEEGQESHRNIFLFKLSEEGDIAFQRTFVNESDAWLTHLIQRGDNKFLAVGTQELEGDKDLLLIQFSNTGHIDWMQIFGAGEVDGEISQETGAVVAVTEKDEIMVVGNTSRLGPQEDDLLVLRLTPDGRIPNCDLMRPLERYPLKDLGTLPIATLVEFTASEVGTAEIEFKVSPSSTGVIRDVCQAKKNLLRR